MPYARTRRGGEALPLAASLRADHGEIAKMLVRSPTRSTIASLRELLGRHNALEEGPRIDFEALRLQRRERVLEMMDAHDIDVLMCTRQGNARVFDYYHRRVRRMQNGLAYHFVIGNGTSTGNGQIEVGDRWRRQINGGHVHSDFLNNIALGICLVGDFNRDQPTRAQLDSCEELTRYLRERCGKADGRAIPVRPHREMNPARWATDCPGDAFPYSWFRRF